MGGSETSEDVRERIDSGTAVARLVLLALAAGVAATGIAGALPDSPSLDPLTWMTSVATVAALVTALGVYRVQHRDADDAHQELMDRLSAQDELLSEFASAVQPQDAKQEAPGGDDALTPQQRERVEAVHGPDSIAEAWPLGRGGGDRARLVRLKSGQLVSVYSRGGRTYVHGVDPGRGRSLERGDARRRR